MFVSAICSLLIWWSPVNSPTCTVSDSSSTKEKVNNHLDVVGGEALREIAHHFLHERAHRCDVDAFELVRIDSAIPVDVLA